MLYIAECVELIKSSSNIEWGESGPKITEWSKPNWGHGQFAIDPTTSTCQVSAIKVLPC